MDTDFARALWDVYISIAFSFIGNLCPGHMAS